MVAACVVAAKYGVPSVVYPAASGSYHEIAKK